MLWFQIHIVFLLAVCCSATKHKEAIAPRLDYRSCGIACFVGEKSVRCRLIASTDHPLHPNTTSAHNQASVSLAFQQKSNSDNVAIASPQFIAICATSDPAWIYAPWKHSYPHRFDLRGLIIWHDHYVGVRRRTDKEAIYLCWHISCSACYPSPRDPFLPFLPTKNNSRLAQLLASVLWGNIHKSGKIVDLAHMNTHKSVFQCKSKLQHVKCGVLVK
jgi:hypothetical protein